KSPSAFISYSHDSDDHAGRVLELADALRGRGINVILDQYVHPAPEEGWPLWMDRNIDETQYVLMVCTETYRRRVMGREEPGKGLGVRWEGSLISNRIYHDRSSGSRFIPVLLPGSEPAHIPSPVQGHSYYRIATFDLTDPGFEALYRHLTDQPATPRPDVRALTNLPPRPRSRPSPGPQSPSGGPTTNVGGNQEGMSRDAAPTPTVGIITASSPMRVICPLHGIRTLAVWQKGLSDLAGTYGWVCRLDRWSYGRFSLLAFVTPWSREATLGWLRRQYDAETHDRRLLIEKGQAPSVVAHSFGTYILGYTLLRFDFIRFNKVILCGSILPRDFPWDQLIARGQVQAVRNEFGVRDPWVKWVRWFVRGTGPSGAVGFTCQHPRLEQEEFDFDHGDYFGLDHMEDRWVPFLDRPLPEIPRAEAGPRIPRPQTALPWGLYAVMLALALLAGAVAAYVASRCETGTTAASPASATTAKSAPPAPVPAAVLEGYVTDAETRVPLADVKLTIQDWDTRDGGSPTATTDAAGRFRFGDLRPSDDPTRQVRLIATKPGYDTSTTDPPLGATDHPIKLKTLTPPEGRP
ncbi:MAG TPA: TIR domain-containing protein, partial [Isosphaeraceae bacterium]|nr:TIR domain-containing protein [Isosphaeraceae bacterium]